MRELTLEELTMIDDEIRKINHQLSEIKVLPGDTLKIIITIKIK